MKIIRQHSWGFACAALSLYVVASYAWGTPAISPPQDQSMLGLPTPRNTPESPLVKAQIALGEKIFFDKKFSSDGSVSCSTCHDPMHQFTDGKAVATGVGDRHGTRNAMSLLNVGFQTSLFWDGRAADLESQALNPLLNHVEHNLNSEDQLIGIAKSEPIYRDAFSIVFKVTPDAISTAMIAKALAAYERTLLSGGSSFDLYYYGGDKQALSESAIRGFELFRGRAHCSTCHTISAHDALFTDGEFHASITNLPKEVNRDLSALTQKVIALKNSPDREALDRAITTDKEIAALGRFVVTLNPADIGQFKTPSLRNVALTSPYMHDGSVSSLEEVIGDELYIRGAALNYPIVLSTLELQDLRAFLFSLTSTQITQ